MIGMLAVLILFAGWGLLAFWMHRVRKRTKKERQYQFLADTQDWTDDNPVQRLSEAREFRQQFIDRVRDNHEAIAPELPTEPIRRAEQTQPMQPYEPFVEEGSGGRHRIESRKGIDMLECPNCGDDVLMVQLAGSPTEIALDSTPDPKRGQVIVLGNTCRMVTTPEDWAKVHKYNLPVYRRHNTHCNGFWWGRVHPNHDPDAGMETR